MYSKMSMFDLLCGICVYCFVLNDYCYTVKFKFYSRCSKCSGSVDWVCASDCTLLHRKSAHFGMIVYD